MTDKQALLLGSVYFFGTILAYLGLRAFGRRYKVAIASFIMIVIVAGIGLLILYGIVALNHWFWRMS